MSSFNSSILLLLCAIAFSSCEPGKKDAGLPVETIIDRALSDACEQSLILARSVASQGGRLPKTLGGEGVVETSGPDWWCSGFFPGTLWYLYEYSGDGELKDYASLLTGRLEGEQYNRDTHDLGFMLYCSYGNGLRLTGNESYKTVLLNGARSLATRYDSQVGCIRSWDFNRDKWQFPVIIDNMMNLEYLMWASSESGDGGFERIARSHSDRTMENQFRPDYSCYHVVSYSPATGQVEWRGTHQGLNDDSAWSRGQAWALYGYSMMYRESGDQRYLDQAVKIADFILGHPNLPEDKIPYWDFDDPAIPNSLRDASAASVIASALIEMSRFVDGDKRDEYLDVAETQLRTLASPEYTAERGSNGGFILKHSVGYLLAGSEVDVPLTYADYYYVEALLRYRQYVLKKK